MDDAEAFLLEFMKEKLAAAGHLPVGPKHPLHRPDQLTEEQQIYIAMYELLHIRMSGERLH